MNTLPLIGIGAESPGVGKGFLAYLLHYLYDYRILQFGDLLKQEIVKYLNHRDNDAFLLFATRLKEKGPLGVRAYKNALILRGNAVLSEMYYPGERKELYRSIMQVWGTDVRRSENPWHWTEAMEERFTLLKDNPRPICIADVRFGPEPGSETNFVRNKGGQVIYLHPVSATPRPKDVHVAETLDPRMTDIALLWDRDIDMTWLAFRVIRQCLSLPDITQERFAQAYRFACENNVEVLLKDGTL